MSDSLTLKLSEHPAMRRMLQRLGYRRKTARLVFADSVELNGRYWEGGSRSRYTIVDIIPQTFRAVPAGNPPQFGGSDDLTHTLQPNQCVVSHGTFCGKPSHAAIYMRKADALIWLGTEIALTLESTPCN